jgi:hypothetical protein
MAIDCFAAESVVWMVADFIDSEADDYSVEAAMSKVFASEALQRGAYEALQIRDKILTELPPPPREAADIYERYTVRFAKAAAYLLRKHGKSIAGRQHDLKRVADIGIDLFVGLCVLSRAATLSKAPGEPGAQAIAIGRVFAQQAKRRMAVVVDKGSYPWDVVS